MSGVKDWDYIPRGGALALIKSRHPEVLMDGPAGTGKSRAILQKLVMVAERYQRVRILIWRLTRASITETILPILETHVLYPGHPALADGVTRGGRKVYRFPTGAEIVVAGMNNPTAIMSGQFDIAALFEGTDPGLTITQYEYVLTRLRNGQIKPDNIVDRKDRATLLNHWPRRPDGGFIPQHQSIVDCNPGAAEHWLNKRCEKRIENLADPLYGEPVMQRILSRHGDNPSVTPEYLARLARLTGVRRKRLYEGVWCSAEGQVWPEFDAAVHTVDAESVPGIAWHFGAIDFGFRGPGCFQVWGVTGNRVLYRLMEWYHKERTEDWWTDRIVEVYRRHPLAAVVCDSAEPDRIAMLNRRLAHEFGGRCLPGIAIKANKAVQMGLGVVRDALAAKRLFLVRDALQERDEALAEEELPLCTEDELPGYVFPVTKDGRPIKETPDPVPPQHGCFPAGTPVLMADGSEKAIETVLIGELVWTPNGPERVTDAACTGIKPILRIEHERGVLECTPDHPVFVDGMGFLRADGLLSGMMLTCAPEMGRAFTPPTEAFSRRTSTRAPGLALSAVLRVSSRPPRPVFNLTVEPTHVFHAGLVLVSNCDTMRYAAVYAWGKDYSEKPKPRKYAPGTLGDILGHDILNR